MKIKTMIATLAFMAVSMTAFAQTEKTNKELSTEYKHQIAILNAEIKTLKAKSKADPTNAEYITEMAAKKADLADVKNKKKIVDTAIKTEKANQKAIEKAEKAKKKAEAAAKAAEEMKKNLAKQAK